MIQLYIVDDEELEREGIAGLFDWASMGIRLIGDAWNGHAALRALERVKPDIVISDIRMPGMDGIEFARRLRLLHPDVQFIFVSGYEDFESARSALEVEAAAYLMKPVNEQALLEAIGRIAGSMQERQTRLIEEAQIRLRLKESIPLLREKHMRDLLLGVASYGSGTEQIFSQLGIPLKPGRYAVMAIQLEADRQSPANEDVLAGHARNLAALRIAAEAAGGDSPLPPVMTREGEIALVTPYSTFLRPEEVEEQLESLGERLLRAYDQSGVSVTIGVSGTDEGAGRIPHLYRQASLLLKRRFTAGRGRMIWHEDESGREPASAPLPDMRTFRQETAKAVIASDPARLAALVRDCLGRQAWDKEQTLYMASELVSAAWQAWSDLHGGTSPRIPEEPLPWVTLARMETLRDTEEWLCRYLTVLAGEAGERQSDRGEHTVAAVKEIVRSEYGNPELTVESIAGRIYLTPSYIRKLFKNRTGKTIKDYIVHIRMRKAAELLRQPELKVGAVAGMVGYESVSYFCSVFRHYYGTTPGEFKDAGHGGSY